MTEYGDALTHPRRTERQNLPACGATWRNRFHKLVRDSEAELHVLSTVAAAVVPELQEDLLIFAGRPSSAKRGQRHCSAGWKALAQKPWSCIRNHSDGKYRLALERD